MSAELRSAVYTVLEGFTLPADVRKILEAAYWATPAPGAPGQEAAVGTTLAKVNSLIAWIKVGDVTGPCPSITIDDWEAIALALAALPPSGAGEKTS